MQIELKDTDRTALIKLTQQELKELKDILLGGIVNVRKCPHCHKEFNPTDSAAKSSWDFFNKLFAK